MESSNQTKDKHQQAEREIAKWKQEKKKGEIVLMFDGSGNVAKVKRCEYL